MLGATRVVVDCPAAADALLKKAAAARAVESTAMNAVSSRSHSVFTLYIKGQHEASGQCLDGALNLVDLAGRSVQRYVSCYILNPSENYTLSDFLIQDASVHNVLSYPSNCTVQVRLEPKVADS